MFGFVLWQGRRMASPCQVQAHRALPRQRQADLLGGEGGGSAPATCSVPEGLCGVQKQKKSDSSFSIKFAVKRHRVFLVVFLILHEAALILP